MDRRGLLRDATLTALGAGAGIVGLGEVAHVVDRRRVITGGAAAGTVQLADGVTGRGQLTITWDVATERRRVALTFDDGPGPRWTPMVLDTLEKHDVSATFFMVGRNVRQHASLIRGRMDRHEVGNHSWDHTDMATLDERRARAELTRAHEAISEVVGRAPTLFRPPYGHMGGGAVAAAGAMHYRLILWSRKMREAHYTTGQQVAAVLRETTPGSIILAHDVGPGDRLISLRGLPQMIVGLRERGFELVTVSQLLLGATAPEM